ncbi:MAG: hypothetical protein ABR543_03700 [Gemmatimonadaceae bacterium]
MAPSEGSYRSFIVRLYLENREIDGAPTRLRGIVIDCVGGVQRPLTGLHDVPRFIAEQLGEAGVSTQWQRPRLWSRIAARLSGWRRRATRRGREGRHREL